MTTLLYRTVFISPRKAWNLPINSIQGKYCAAIVKNGKVILFPIKSRYQLRPRLRHMDKADQQLKSTMVKDDSTDDDEPVEKAPVRARVVRDRNLEDFWKFIFVIKIEK